MTLPDEHYYPRIKEHNNMSIYLASPIDQVTESQRRKLERDRAAVTSALTSLAYSVYDPASAWDCAGPLDPAVAYTNEAALESATGLFVIWPEDTPSVGVGVELGIARQLGIPTAVWSNRRSYTLAGMAAVFEGHRAAVAHLDSVLQKQEDPTPRAMWTGPGRQPTKAHHDDAGWDLYCTTDVYVGAGDHVDIPAEISIEWPHGWWGLILGRSSTFRNLGLIVNPAVIDAGYRGPLFAAVRNIGLDGHTVEAGDRIAQIIPMPTLGVGIEMEHVAQLSDSARGDAGFGSTGR